MLKLGTQNIQALYLGGEQVKKAYLGETVVFGGKEPAPSRLPEGYTEVEYIQSSGTQYIVTGVKPTLTMKFMIDIEPTGDLSTSSNPFAGSYYYTSSPGYSRRFLIWRVKQGIQVTAYAERNGVSAIYATLSSDISPRRIKIIVDYVAKQAYIEGEDTKSIQVAVSTSMDYITLLTSHQAGSNYTSAKLYSCRIEQSGVSVRDFVPCIDPSGAVGLYDLVGGKFYGNAGTGVFAAGPVV